MNRPIRVHIETAGCAFNVSDSEAMAGVLLAAGYEIAPQPGDADVLILNTCTVKDKTFRTFRRRLRELSVSDRESESRRIVLAGCIPKAQPKASYLDGFSILGPDAVGRVDEVVRETLRGRTIRLMEHDGSRERNRLPVLRRNSAVEILPIARGCRSACTFCQTRLARGRLVSFPVENILAQARRALDQGVRIFWVTGQDTGAYGHDIGTGLPELLRALLDLPGDFRVRLGMSSPAWIAQRLGDCIAILGHPKMFKFLHVPLQSGSDRILDAMRRDGGVAEFRAIHTEFRRRFPKGSFVTDLIAGYPDETEDDFEQTLGLVRELGLGLVNVSKFSPRPGTAAARLPMLPHATIRDRTSRLMSLVGEIGAALLHRMKDSERDVILEQCGRGELKIARTEEYRPVHIETTAQAGARFRVLITGVESLHLLGTPIDMAAQGAT